MPWWESPAFYLAVISLMANIGNYLKSRSTQKMITAVTPPPRILP